MIYRRLSDPDENGFTEVIEYDSDGNPQCKTLHQQFFSVLNLYLLTDGRYGISRSKLHGALFYAPYPRSIHNTLRLEPKWHATKVPFTTDLSSGKRGDIHGSI